MPVTSPRRSPHVATWCALIALRWACASAEKQASGATAPAAASTPPPESVPPAHVPPGLAVFDRQFAPLWQRASGSERRALVCAAVDELTASAAEIAIGDVPVAGREREIAWQRDAELLARAVEELAAACEAGAAFEPALGQVYDRYHALAELVDPGRPPRAVP
jgi:hypothetical protein